MEFGNPVAPNPADDGLHRMQIIEEQVQHIFERLPITVVAGPLMGACVTALLLCGYVDPASVYTWIALVFASYSSLLILWVWYRLSGAVTANAVRWGRRYLLLSWLSAASWGSVSLLLFPVHSVIAQMILALAVMTGCAAITVATIVYRPDFYTMSVLMLPLFVQFVRVGDRVHDIFAVAFLAYSGMLFFINSSVNRVIEQSLRLRFDNDELASDLRKQKEIAEKSSMAKSRFLAIASHDLRQPLQAHSLFLGELQERLHADNTINGIVDKLESSLVVIIELFDSLLDVSRLEVGSVETRVQGFYIDDFMNPIVEQFRAQAETVGLEFRSLLPHYAVRSDRGLLGRIIRNLLDNAIRNTRQGKILLGCRRRGDSLLVQVFDTGCGIKQNQQGHIFEDYYRLKHRDSRHSRSLGLGLAVVRQLCGVLGHTVAVKSKYGKGSVFSVALPLAVTVDPLQRDMGVDVLREHELDGLRVLVIDDDELVQKGMAGILEAWKCDVVTQASLRSRERFWDIPVPKIDSIFDGP